MDRLGAPCHDAVRLAWLVGLSLLLASCHHVPETGRFHVVRAGENVYRIAQHYRVSVSEIIEANEIRDVRDIPVGARLWVPRARKPVPPPAPLQPPVTSERAASARPPHHTRLAFAWPLRGRLTSRFGNRDGRLHEGIDLAARPGTLVRAAEAGRVIFSSAMGAYGRMVVVRHDGRYASVYAHNRRNRVQRGSFVDKGEVVAEVGTSGNATGPHLHFEIRRDDRPEDPLLHLP